MLPTFFQASLDLTGSQEIHSAAVLVISPKESLFNYVYEILHIIVTTYLVPPIDIGEGIPLLLKNLHIIDISSTTYLPYFVNVVKERPLKALLGPFAPLKLRLNCCSKSSKCVGAA